MTDPLAFGLSLTYVVVVLALAETLRRRYALPGDFTRKFVHIAIGTWSVPTFHLFTLLPWAAALPALFIGLNLLSYKLKFFAAIEEESGDNLGTILFPISFLLLLIIFWNTDYRVAAMMGLMALAWGDAFAAIIGRRYGRLKYRMLGEERSLEGSAAMYCCSLLAVTAVLMLEMPHLKPMAIALTATAVATGCTLVEAIALRGTDNLLIPLSGAAIGWAMLLGSRV